MRFADPKANIEAFRLEPGMLIADFGAGIGAYTLAAAHAVGRRGRVYAIDIQQELLGRIKGIASREKLDNVEIVWGDIESKGGSKLPDESVDAVIISNTLFLMEDKDGIAREAFRIVRRKGRVLVIDWKDSFGGLGPAAESVVSEREARALFEKHGFSPERDIQAGAHHYGIVFKKT
ncbi:class I SAM-dependent methyltransferase [Candidatus Kaiserbacteria bacterium]|nr:class I SAM-dependent methyltransferase [Candidatus Kaiserbacteria bacterium]